MSASPWPPGSRILGVSLGDCAHVAGIRRFLALAERGGLEVRFAGPAQPVAAVVREVAAFRPQVLAVSYRLTPQALARLLPLLRDALRQELSSGLRMVFGGTDPNCEVARQSGLFSAVFGSEASEETCLAFLGGSAVAPAGRAWPETLVARIRATEPTPLLRHHFGQPTVEATVEGARRIAEAGVLDVLSLGPDQNAQQSFFRPEEMDPAQDGAGGVPLRAEGDLERIYAATRTGNRPLVRCYSGTRDLVRMAEILRRTIHNSWAAVPLFWYSVLDRRSNRELRQAIEEGQEAIGWHAERGVPVEVNESHQWSLRGAPDAVAVAAFYIAAHNARRRGVRDFVAQFMFNTPAGTAPWADLAKMLAKLDLVADLAAPGFSIWRQTRTGLLSLPPDPDEATGRLCGSIGLQLALGPHILHVVGPSEAHHAATAEDVIRGCRTARGTIGALGRGLPDMSLDPHVAWRRQELVAEARATLAAIAALAPSEVEDPLADPATLERAVRTGVLDAPDLAGSPAAAGRVRTAIVNGACRALDERGHPLTEAERLSRLPCPSAPAQGSGVR